MSLKNKLTYLFLMITLFNCHHIDEVKSNSNVCGYLVTDVEDIQIFPPTHPLNTDISGASVDSRSSAIISFLSENFSGGLKADFGSGQWEGAPIGIPFVVVCDKQPEEQITFRGDSYDDNYGSQSDPGPYPIPLNAPIEGNGQEDSHVLAVDVDNNMLYELYNADATSSGWRASSGAVFDLTKEEYRPEGWTSADAAGLPIFPCLLRYDEVASGEVDHAIRFTLSKSKIFKGYVHPARHLVFGGGNTNSDVPTPMGMRLRLKANFDITSYSASNKTILKAMKKYGIILADIGSNFFISGAPDSRWDNDDLLELGNVKPSDFEVVQMGDISVD